MESAAHLRFMGPCAGALELFVELESGPLFI